MRVSMRGLGGIALILMGFSVMGCETLKGLIPKDVFDEQEPMHEEHPELCQVEKTKTAKFPPVVMTYSDKQLYQRVIKIRKDIMREMRGVPSHWFDFEYAVEPQKTGDVEITVTACLKDKYLSEFEASRDGLYDMLKEGA